MERAFAAVLLVLTLGCRGVEKYPEYFWEPPDGEPTTDGGSPVRTDGGSPVRRVTVSGQVLDSSSTALEGMTFCVYEEGPESCVTTGADGRYSLTLPADTNTGLLGEKAGYPKLFRLLRLSGNRVLTTLVAANDTEAAVNYTTMGAAYPLGEDGALTISAADPATCSALSPSAGVGPIYLNEYGAPDLALIAMSTSHTATFAKLPPGDYEGDVRHPSMICSVADGWGWPSNTHSFRARVLAGYETFIAPWCH